MDRHVKNNHVEKDDEWEEFEPKSPPSSPLKSRTKADRSSVKDYDNEWEEFEPTTPPSSPLNPRTKLDR